MAFFDELGKKLTDGGQKAAEQARAFAEVNKLNSQVSEQEKKITQFYAQIGRDYYEAHTNDPEDCVKASVEAINLAKQTIEKLKAQITAIKGDSTCPKCGAAISKGTVFCSQCGEKIPAAPEPFVEVVLKCPSCGTAVEAGQRFCVHCGCTLPDTAEEAQPATKKCPECGAEVEADAICCTSCGQKLD